LQAKSPSENRKGVYNPETGQLELKGNDKRNIFDIYRSIINKAAPISKLIMNKYRVNPSGVRIDGLPLNKIFAKYTQAPEGKRLSRADMFKYLSAWSDIADNKRGIDSGESTQDAYGTIAELDKKSDQFAYMKNEYAEFMNYIDDYAAASDPQSAKIVELKRKANAELELPPHGDWFPRQRAGKSGSNSRRKRVGGSGDVKDSFEQIKTAVEQRLQEIGMSELNYNLALIGSDVATAPIGGLIREIGDSPSRIGIMKELKERARKAVSEEGDTPPSAIDDEQVLGYAYSNGVLDSVAGTKFPVMTYYDGQKLRFYEVDPRYATAVSREMPWYANSIFYKYGVRAPMSLLKLPWVAKTLSSLPVAAFKIAASISLTVVLPLLPVIATTGITNFFRQ
jgi:hypothetical protein